MGSCSSGIQAGDTMNTKHNWPHPLVAGKEHSVCLSIQHVCEDPCQNDSHLPEEFTSQPQGLSRDLWHPLVPEAPRGLERGKGPTVPVSVDWIL